jgi:nitrogen PTS system EIIA component
MPYRMMSLARFSQLVGLPEQEVARMAGRGELPAERFKDTWRFHTAQTTAWLSQYIPTLDPKRLRQVERFLTAEAVGDPQRLVFCELLSVHAIDLELTAGTKASALRNLVALAANTGLLYDPATLLEHLQAREDLSSTALPGGIAVPHPPRPMPYVSAEPFACLARSAQGLGFSAPDGGLTTLFVLICCHDNQHHLHVLARLMRILNSTTVASMHAATTAEDMLGLLVTREQQVVTETR